MTTDVAEAHALLQDADTLRQLATGALNGKSAEDFELFERQLNAMEGACREIHQAFWADDAQATIRRLEEGEPLTEADREVIRAFLISDAMHYLAMENNYQDWIGELNRLLDEITRRAAYVTRESISDLRGVVKDAVRLVPSIRNYLDERNRVERCDVAMDSLDEESRTLLARIITVALQEPNR